MDMKLKRIYDRVRIIGRTLTTENEGRKDKRVWTNGRLDGILRRRCDGPIDLSGIYKVGLKGDTVMLIFT